MPVDVRYRDTFVKDLNDNLSSITVNLPPAYTSGVAFPIEYVNSKTWSEDLSRIQGATNPLVLISFPNEDQKYIERFMNDLGHELKVYDIDFQRGDEVPDSFDLVNDANTITFTIDITENNISFFEVYTDIPTGSTSRLRLIVKDNETKKILIRKIFSNLEIERGGWTRLNTGLSFWDTSKTLEITFEEFSYGSQPDGIRIYKNVGGDCLLRTYYHEFRTNKQQWFTGIMRLEIHAKDKTVESTPSGATIHRRRITNAVNQALQNHIRAYWENLQRGAHFLEFAGTMQSSEFMSSEYDHKEQLDVKIRYLTVTTLQDLKVIKKIKINQINLL